MTHIRKIDSAAFGGLLTSDFINRSVPENSEIDPALELIKGKASLLALSLFDAGKRDLRFEDQITFSSLFPQTYGAGFTKALSTLVAYVICLEESSEERSEPVVKFAEKVEGIAKNVFDRLEEANGQFSDLRKTTEQLDNHGGYYDRTYLSEATAQNLTPNGKLTVSLSIDPCSGHAIAQVPDLSQALLNAYRGEIKTHLTEEGQAQLRLPNNTGFVVVAYKEELESVVKTFNEKANADQETERTLKELETELSLQKIDLSFTKPYIVPVRGDNRYSLVASILIEAPTITTIREQLGLKPLYSEGRPLRFTFGAVHNQPVDCDDLALIQRMKRCESLSPFINFIEAHLPIKV